MSVLIRPYQPADRSAVRRLCCDTGDAGQPIDRWFPDRELFADLVAAPYTDFMAAWAQVAEVDGEVLGYVLGSLDPARQRRAQWSSALAGLLAAGLRGTLWSRAWWPLVRANLRLRRAANWGSLPDERLYSAEVHVNLRPRARGASLGARLVNGFLQQARDAGARGVKASVREDNEGGRRFFERLGFEPLARRPLLRLPDGTEWRRIWYGLRLDGGTIA